MVDLGFLKCVGGKRRRMRGDRIDRGFTIEVKQNATSHFPFSNSGLSETGEFSSISGLNLLQADLGHVALIARIVIVTVGQ